MLLTTKTQLRFEPGANGIALDAAGTPYTTPTDWQEELADLARLPYVNATLKYKLAQSAKPAAGAATLKLLAGATVVQSVAIDLTAAQVASGSVAVDLSAVAGQTGLSLELDVGTAADAGTTGELWGALDIDVPLTVSNC